MRSKKEIAMLITLEKMLSEAVKQAESSPKNKGLLVQLYDIKIFLNDAKGFMWR